MLITFLITNYERREKRGTASTFVLFLVLSQRPPFPSRARTALLGTDTREEKEQWAKMYRIAGRQTVCRFQRIFSISDKGRI